MSDLMKGTYADAARAYLRSKRVFRYHLKKIDELSDDEVVQKCHFYQEENDLVQDYWAFVKRKLSSFGIRRSRVCSSATSASKSAGPTAKYPYKSRLLREPL